MPTPRPIAKISAPRLFGVVARQRLFGQLDVNRGRPLLWIDGPPGAGKTTLVASYLEARGIPALWYQVEPGDADPANLFHYLGLAVEQRQEAGAAPMPRLGSENLSDPLMFARTFFRQLFSRLPLGAVLVFDNYQEAPADGLLHEAIRTAVAEVPPGSSLCCISRIEPPASFSQLVASGVQFGIHWESLRLSMDETREIAAGRDIREEVQIETLHRQSEGWAAGITLMLERAASTPQGSARFPVETRESVFHYFASLLFDHSAESVRQTLLAVAFLPYVTPSMARQLDDRHDPAVVLDQLYRRHMFTDRRPGPEPIYQFHALFRDFLQARAQESHGEAEIRGMRIRSAQALEAQGDVEAAMDLRLEARDWEEAARLILTQANALLASGRRQTLQHWILALPEPVYRTRPWMPYWLGMARVQTEPAKGIETLRKAHARFREVQDIDGEVLCLCALLNAAFVGYQAVEAMDGWLDALLAKLERFESQPSPEVELRVWGVICTALFWSRPSHPWACSAVGRVERLLGCTADPNVALAAACSAIATASLSGDFDSADRIADSTAQLVDLPDVSPAAATWWLDRTAHLRFLETRYEEALALIRRACQVAESNGMRSALAIIIYTRFMMEFRVSGWSVANATLAEMEALPRPSHPIGEGMLYIYQARRAQHRGRADEAADLSERTFAAMLRSGSSYQEMLFGLVNAECLLAAGRIERAAPIIASCRDLIARAPVLDCFRAAPELIEAFYWHVQGRREAALTKLREALVLARAHNRRFSLRYFECTMPPMFSLALEAGIETDLVQQLIRLFRLQPPVAAPDNWPWPIRVHTLGRFSLAIDDSPMEFSRKVPKKTLALLKALVAFGGREVPEQSLCDALWGEEEADAARNALGITVVRLRKLLGSIETVVHHGGTVSLDRSAIWVDAWRFDEIASQPAGQADGAPSPALMMYGGNFLPGDEGEPWSVPMRERLRGKFIQALASNAQKLESILETEMAIGLYSRGIDADPIVEIFYQGLMRCHRQQGRPTEAISVYRRLRQTLSVVLGVPPSAETQALYRDIMAAAATEEPPPQGNVLTLTQVGSDHLRKASRPGGR